MTPFKPYYFDLHEFLPKETYQELYPVYGEKLWRMFPFELVWTVDQLRMKYGKGFGNDWHWRKNDPEASQYRGWRPMDCLVGAKLSQHKFYRAFDWMPDRTTADVIRWDCLQYPFDPPFMYITEIEKNVPWFHFAIGTHDKHLGGITII